MSDYFPFNYTDRTVRQATASAEHHADLQMARHLRWDHGLSRRKVAKRLGRPERWVKYCVDEQADER